MALSGVCLTRPAPRPQCLAALALRARRSSTSKRCVPLDARPHAPFPARRAPRGAAPLPFHPRSAFRSTPQYKEQRLRVKFAGGREVVGVLKSFDGLQNIVLDDAVEFLRDPADANTVTEATRYLGLLVVRGTATTILGPEDGLHSIANPFLGEEEEGAAEAAAAPQ